MSPKSKATQDMKDVLRRNAVDIKIIFEQDQTASHQDFADCGKAKAIPKSMVTSFDVRDQRNNCSRLLVLNNPFLTHYVDATASHVNLSGGSRKIWSMSAIRLFVGYVHEAFVDESQKVHENVEGASEFIDALVRHLPQLSELEATRIAGGAGTTTGSLRDLLGGDIALRSIGMSLFARAFVHCKKHRIDYELMAERLSKLDWHMLDRERSEIPQEAPNYTELLIRAARPTWAPLLVIGEHRYRISAGGGANATWERIYAEVLQDLPLAA